MRDSDESIRARLLRQEADALDRVDQAKRVLHHINTLILAYPGDERLRSEERALIVDISKHRAEARDAMKARGDNVEGGP